MIRNLFLTSLSVLSFFNTVNAQTKPQTKFFRPSMTTTFIAPRSNESKKVYEGFKNVPMEARFDHRKVTSSVLNVNLPAKPEVPVVENPLEMKKAMETFKKSKADWDSLCKREVSSKLAIVTREVVGNMFGRDAQGNLSYEKIMEAAAYSATDAQALSAGASANSNEIYTGIAEELLQRGYIVVYDIKTIQTYDQYYDQQEARAQALAAKTGKPAQPIKRVLEGWRIDFDFSIHRLDWNESVSTVFYTQAWLDANVTDPADRNAKKAAFDNFIFPTVEVYSSSAYASASQSNDPQYYTNNPFAKRKTMDELLAELPVAMQEDMIFKGGRNIDDFKMRAPIYQDYPTMVKLGTKEGLYYDERFFVYEIVTNKDGNQDKKRRGVLRPSNIADNTMIANGESPASKFRQQGGRKLYQGELVELKEDYGVGLSLGYGLLDNVAGGINIGLDVRIPRYTKGIIPNKINKYLRNLHLNANLGYNMFSDIALIQPTESFEAYAASVGITDFTPFRDEYNEKKYSGSSMLIGVSLSREMYFTKKGNIFVSPELGVNILSITAENNDDANDVYEFSNLAIAGGLGIGYHLSPMIQLFGKAMVNYKLGTYEITSNSGIQVDNSGNVTTGSVLYSDYQEGFTSEPIEKLSSDWGFDKMNVLSTPVYFGIRFKF